MPNNSRLAFGLICLSLTACNDSIIDLKGKQHIRVYQDDAKIACQDAETIALETHGKLLIDENIELHCSQKGHDGMAYTESCGSETGSINIFTIHVEDLSTAESLGFSQLSSLPDAQFDNRCEYKVISDPRKYSLIEQLSEQHAIWTSNKQPDYQFQFHVSFSDCPTFVPLPTVTIAVTDDTVNTVYDINKDVYLTNIDDYMTIDQLFEKLDTQLKLTPLEAGLNVSDPKVSPAFSALGVPEQYFINAGGEACDAANYTISHVVLPQN